MRRDSALELYEQAAALNPQHSHACNYANDMRERLLPAVQQALAEQQRREREQQEREQQARRLYTQGERAHRQGLDADNLQERVNHYRRAQELYEQAAVLNPQHSHACNYANDMRERLLPAVQQALAEQQRREHEQREREQQARRLHTQGERAHRQGQETDNLQERVNHYRTAQTLYEQAATLNPQHPHAGRYANDLRNRHLPGAEQALAEQQQREQRALELQAEGNQLYAQGEQAQREGQNTENLEERINHYRRAQDLYARAASLNPQHSHAQNHANDVRDCQLPIAEQALAEQQQRQQNIQNFKQQGDNLRTLALQVANNAAELIGVNIQQAYAQAVDLSQLSRLTVIEAQHPNLF